jgi:hypothetical protein
LHAACATLQTKLEKFTAGSSRRGEKPMIVRAMALLLLLSPSVGQPELNYACRDPARRNPCEGHREVACFLAGISLREVHHLRAWVRDPEMEAKAYQMNHQQDEAKEVGRYELRRAPDCTAEEAACHDVSAAPCTWVGFEGHHSVQYDVEMCPRGCMCDVDDDMGRAGRAEIAMAGYTVNCVRDARAKSRI